MYWTLNIFVLFIFSIDISFLSKLYTVSAPIFLTLGSLFNLPSLAALLTTCLINRRNSCVRISGFRHLCWCHCGCACVANECIFQGLINCTRQNVLCHPPLYSWRYLLVVSISQSRRLISLQPEQASASCAPSANKYCLKRLVNDFVTQSVYWGLIGGFEQWARVRAPHEGVLSSGDHEKFHEDVDSQLVQQLVHTCIHCIFSLGPLWSRSFLVPSAPAPTTQENVRHDSTTANFSLKRRLKIK